jgi:hypothetical protein
MHGAIQSNTGRVEEEEEVVAKEMIFTCCNQGDVATLQLWASQGVEELLGGDLLTKAVASDKIDVVRFLIEKLGANVHRTNKDGCTSLHNATVNAHLDVMRMLVNDFGANVGQAISDGSTPLIMAALQGHLECDALPGPGAWCLRRPCNRCGCYSTEIDSPKGKAECRAIPGRGALRRRHSSR